MGNVGVPPPSPDLQGGHKKLMSWDTTRVYLQTIYRWTAHWLHPCIQEMSDKSDTHNVQFFVTLGSQNLCQTIIQLVLKANECKIHQWLKMVQSRLDLFGFLKAVMGVNSRFLKLHSAYRKNNYADEASTWTPSYTKSHIWDYDLVRIKYTAT